MLATKDSQETKEEQKLKMEGGKNKIMEQIDEEKFNIVEQVDEQKTHFMMETVDGGKIDIARRVGEKGRMMTVRVE